MTAPDLQRVIEEAIAGETEYPVNAHIVAQARAVLAALTEAGTVEWGVQTKTFVDGDWDRVWTKNVNGQPFTEDDARNHLWLKSPIPFRAVSRLTLPWSKP